MKVLYMIFLYFLASLFISCEKCEICEYITEDNYYEQLQKCEGDTYYGLDHPRHYKESARVLVDECDVNSFEFPVGVVSTFTVCDGVVATYRARLECK